MALDLGSIAIKQAEGIEAGKIADAYLQTVGLKKVGEYTSSAPVTGTVHPQQP